jgi:hypothetical protein
MSGEVLSFLLGAEDDTLREFAADSETRRLGKTLVKDGPLRITLVALKKGTVLSSHQVAGSRQHSDSPGMSEADHRQGRYGSSQAP